MASHIVIGHDESGAVHLYKFAGKQLASNFIHQVKDLADITWEQYIMETSTVHRAVESIKEYVEEGKEMSTLEKAKRYAMGECLADYYEGYTYEEVCKMLDDHSLNKDKKGQTIVYPSEALEDTDVTYVMALVVDAYMEGAK